MLYWFGKIVVAPFFFLIFRPVIHNWKGLRSKGPVVYLCNHFSLADAVALAHHFEKWARYKKQFITVVDDGTSTNETRLGAVKDIQFAIDKLNIDDDLLVIAGDNLLDFSLTKFIDYAKEKNSSCIMRYFESNEEKLKKCGVVSIDSDDKIVLMEEKPEHPKSKWCCPPFYYYTKEDAKLVKVGIDSGCGVDAPGSYIAWLCSQVSVYAMEMLGKRYDIGNLESYEQVQKNYNGIF